MKKAIVFTLLFCFAFTYAAYAKDVWEMAASPKYGEKAGGMLGRGLLNVATCFVDPFVGAVHGAQTGSPEFLGAIGGFATGTACAVLRATSGVIDVAGSWIPGFNGIPICRNYGECFSCTAPSPAAPMTTSYASPAPITTYQEPAPAPILQEESRLKYIKK